MARREDGRGRALAALCIAVVAAATASGTGCGARRPTAREPEEIATPPPRPSPTRRPRPRPTPRPTPTSTWLPAPNAPEQPLATPPGAASPGAYPAGGRDVTREPFTRAIDARTPEPTARALEAADRARVELESGTTGRAIDLADEALRISPNSVPAWVVRARALLAEGSPGLARSDLDHAATLSPDPAWMAEIVALQGATLEAEGKNEAALAAYRRAVVTFPANRTARDGLRRLSSP